MELYKLNKLSLSIKSLDLLDQLTTNTLDKHKNAFLDRVGKIVVTFDQIKIKDDEVLVLIEKQFLDKLMNHLDKFLKLSKTKIEKKDYNIYFDLDNDYKPDKEEFIIPQKLGKLIITKKDLQSNISNEEFTSFRLKNNIPIQGIDYNDEMLLNVNEEDFASFTKGCFLGQEIIARVHNLAKPPRKLVVKSENELNQEQLKIMTSKIKDKETGKLIGFIFVNNK